MAKQLTIIGSISEKEDIEVLCSKLQEIGIEPRVLYPSSDYKSKRPAVCAQVAILWISSKSDEQVFKTANERNTKGNTTINYFADAVTLSDDQRKTIGRNKSVFADLNPDDSVSDLFACADLKFIDTERRNDSDDSEISKPSNRFEAVSASPSIDSVSKGSNNAEEENGIVETDESQVISPLNAISIMLGAVIGSVILIRTVSFSPGSFWGYVVLGAPIVVVFKTLKKIIQCLRITGFNLKILLAFVVAIISILISLCLMYGWFLTPYW